MIVTISIVLLIACSPRVREDGDFSYVIEKNKVSLVGLTKSGQSKEILIIPKNIKGKEVIKMYYKRGWLAISGGTDYYLKSTNLKKVFVMGENFWQQYSTFHAPNLDKVIRMPIDYMDLNFPLNSGYATFYYIPYSKKYSYIDKIGTHKSSQFANISYMQNYEGSEQNNEGYYWVDHENYGNTISPPPTPNRSGYTFDGWYKEPSCLNKWDFEVDRLPEEIIEEIKNDKDEMIERPIYQNTYLYAKWTKK